MLTHFFNEFFKIYFGDISILNVVYTSVKIVNIIGHLILLKTNLKAGRGFIGKLRLPKYNHIPFLLPG